MAVLDFIAGDLNSFIWGWFGIGLLLGTGILMTVLTKFFQVSHFGHWMKQTLGSIFSKKVSGHIKEKGTISQFQALCTALAATIGVGNIAGVAAAIVIAYFGRILVGAELLAAGAQETIFIKLARDLFPAAVSGILLAAIIAASMSTADSQLLVASSSFTSDIYKPVFRKDASDKELLWIGRIVVLIVAVIAYFIANSKGSGAAAIMDMVGNAWGGFGSAFGPVVLLSLFWKRLTYKGAFAGIAAGAIVDIAWYFLLTAKTGIYELLPGFAAGLIVAILVSLIDKKPSQEVEAIFARATDKSIDD